MECHLPDHSVIGEFINNYILPKQYEIFTTINKQIIKELNLNINDFYNDGTKFEANANKYKFVWKPKKYHQILDAKIKMLISSIGYDVSFTKDELIKAKEFSVILNNYVETNNIKIESIPTGKGHRKKVKKEIMC